MSSTRHIADTVGREEIAKAVGVGATAVSNAVVREFFPATWFLAINALCKTKGIDCPPHLFRMKGANSQDVDKTPVCQGSGVK